MSRDALAIEHEQASPGTTVVVVSGDVTFANAEPFGRSLFAALSAGARHVVVDLSGVGFMDSSGLAALLAASRAARADSARISLVQRPAAPLNVLRFKGIERLVSLHASRDEALGGAQRSIDDMSG